MSELSLLFTVAKTLPGADTGAGTPPRIPGHEADRLASLPAAPATGRAAAKPAARRRRGSTGRGLRALLPARSAAAPPA
ncbi:hypothetical protein ACIQGZ_21865 [Streptomyces sp. NPDC092296]|uniref:hypothetical protein n=1 Tax=Streptomyces sp. NPDC092296 TaxID=3366012 RepID=UPI00382DCC71